MCESCLLPFKNDPGQRESERYCSLCYSNGRLHYQGNDLKEFQRMVYQSMRERGMNLLKAKFFTWAIRFAPRWKNAK
jgi:hypothetical protein